MSNAIAVNAVKNKGMGLSFFQLTPERIGRIEHLGLFSFWVSVFFIAIALPQIIRYPQSSFNGLYKYLVDPNSWN